MRNENIIPQIIVYTPAELQRLVAMQKRGVIPFASLPVPRPGPLYARHDIKR